MSKFVALCRSTRTTRDTLLAAVEREVILRDEFLALSVLEFNFKSYILAQLLLKVFRGFVEVSRSFERVHGF